MGFDSGSGGEESADSLGERRGRFRKNLTRHNRNGGSRDRCLHLSTLLSLSRGCDSLSLGGGGFGGHGPGGSPVGDQGELGGYFPFANSSASQVWGHFLANTSGSPYSVGGEVDMSYLGRSESAAGEGQTVLGGGRGGRAGGALPFPFSWRAGLVMLVGVGRDPLEEGVAYCGTPGRWGGKGA